MKTKVSAVELNIGTLFHCLLFAQQKAIRDALGSGSEAFVQPMLEILAKVAMEGDVKIFEFENVEEAVASFSKMLVDSGIVKNVNFRKTGQNRYLLKVEGCAWAKHIHKELEPKDVTCPFALIVMAMHRKYSREKVEETDSKYLADGTETEIRPLFSNVHVLSEPRKITN
jgi:hypothetical protein